MCSRKSNSPTQGKIGALNWRGGGGTVITVETYETLWNIMRLSLKLSHKFQAILKSWNFDSSGAGCLSLHGHCNWNLKLQAQLKKLKLR